VNDLRNTLASEGLFSETTLDIIQDLSMRWIRFVEEVPEVEVCRAQPVTEMLGKDPAAVRVRRLLNGMCRGGPACVEERIVRETIQQRRLLHNLEDRVLNRGCIRAGERVEIDAHDGDPVRELLDVLAARVKRVKVVEVRERAEELSRAAHLIADDEAAFARTLDFQDLCTDVSKFMITSRVDVY
jgi:hypothetical protein